MYMMKLVWNNDTTDMIYWLDVGADVHDFSVLEYQEYQEHLSVKLLCVCGEQ